VSYDPVLSLKCLSIKDSVDKSNPDQINDVIANVTMIEDKCNLDMATVFFGAVFGPGVAPRVMSGIIAASIFGNVVVMTFTASRGRQPNPLRPRMRILILCASQARDRERRYFTFLSLFLPQHHHPVGAPATTLLAPGGLRT
jgi:hypothetical protein